MTNPHPTADSVTPATSVGPPETVPPDGPVPDAEPKFGPPAKPNELGTLGRYRILAPLGKGGMGVVYLAYDPRLGRRVAVKVMRPAHAISAAARERFLREARAAARIDHPNVASVYDVDVAGGVPYIAMPYLKGCPLSDYLRDKGPPSVGQAVRVGQEIALGLAAAHAAGVVHRDVKPANVWLEAPDGKVKLLDFGLAKPDTSDAHLTQSGAVLGTPAYMAPEQARGRKVDHRADLFSLGVVLYRLITGQPPFAGGTGAAVIAAVAADTPPPVQSHGVAVPDDLAALIHQLLEKDPANRPPSAADVAARLAAIDRPQVVVLAAPPALAVSSQESVFGDLDAGPTRTVVPPGRVKTPWGMILGAVFAATVAVGIGYFALVKRPVATETKRPVATEAKRPTQAPTPTPAVPDDPTDDTLVCRWLADRGATVGVEHNGVWKTVPPGQPLPPPPVLLRSVDVMGTLQVSGADAVARVAGSPAAGRVAQWHLAGQNVSAETLDRILAFPSLVYLNLNGCLTTDADARRVADSGRRLTWLGLADSPAVTNAAVAALGRLTALQHLDVRQSGIDAGGVRQLRDKLPTATVRGDDTPLPPANPAWEAEVARQPTAEKKLDLVLKELARRNPGFDGKAISRQTDGADVVAVRLDGRALADLTPLAALPALREVVVSAQPEAPAGPLTDLAPLKRLRRLTVFEAQYQRVADLAPLEGLPLTRLIVLYGGPVASLRPLAGMKLTDLFFGPCPVADLSPLTGMPLTSLFMNAPEVTDYSPVRRAPISQLMIVGAKATDFDFLRDLPLTRFLMLDTTTFESFAPVGGKRLVEIDFRGTPAADFDVLVGMPLESLRADAAAIRSAGVFRRMTTLQWINGRPAAEFWAANPPGK